VEEPGEEEPGEEQPEEEQPEEEQQRLPGRWRLRLRVPKRWS
jgi:hypothetical protein